MRSGTQRSGRNILKMYKRNMHTPVLFTEVMKVLDVKPGKKYIDATLGEGGFTKAIAEKKGNVLALDWDEEQIKQVQRQLSQDISVQFATANFADIEQVAIKHEYDLVDGILFDLGLSMRQISESGRGFSFKHHSEPLDMRINRGTTPVSEYINNYSFEDLYEVLTSNSEELNSRTIVQSLVRTRTIKPFETVGDLVSAIDKALEKNNSISPNERQKTYTRVFQAFRIQANNEFDNIKKGLEGAVHILKPEGVIIVITFHSLEDRIVKRFCKNMNMKGTVIRKKDGRTFERSAKVRVLRFLV